jgi:hypothetical protein
MESRLGPLPVSAQASVTRVNPLNAAVALGLCLDRSAPLFRRVMLAPLARNRAAN